MKKISFTIPCYRSEATVGHVINEIIEAMREKQEYDYEIIAVNDCSPDNVYEVLYQIAKDNKKIKLIDLAINGGKHAALMAAFSIVSGDYIVGVDDDGQCPMNRLWDLIEPLENGYDMSMARYPQKKQSILKNLGSKINHIMSRVMLNKPKNLTFSNFTARKKFLVEEIIRYKNPYPYLEGLTLRATRKIALVDMEERARVAGKSGYTFMKSLGLWMNGYTAFSVKPLRIATMMGFLFSVSGFLFALTIIIKKLINPGIQMGYTSLMAVILIIGGLIMLLLGMMGEYIGRMYICMNNSPQYVIRETVNYEIERE